MMGNMMGDTTGGASLWMALTLTLLAVAVGLGVAVVLTARSTGPTGSAAADSDPATDILRRRYAAGEIDESQFQRQLSRLADR
jgi:uncharacterized membrane protein